MSPRLLLLATLSAALGSGLVAGVFFAFSTFVMPALARLPPGQGVAAMQAINVAAINRWLMGALFGTGAVCLVLVATSLFDWGAPGSGLRLGGSVVYLAGAILVTAACNVPRNDALAPLAAGGAEAATLWPRYLSEWTSWNHVRGAAALLAALLLTLALVAAQATRGAPGR
jgi:uncharacterized membrane protein